MAILNGLPKNKKENVFYATISTTWTDNGNGTHTQDILIPDSGITANDTIQTDHVYTGDHSVESYATYVEADTQYFEHITNGIVETINGGIRLIVFDTVNTVEIPIIVIVV